MPNLSVLSDKIDGSIIAVQHFNSWSTLTILLWGKQASQSKISLILLITEAHESNRILTLIKSVDSMFHVLKCSGIFLSSSVAATDLQCQTCG